MKSKLKIPEHIGIIMDGNGRWARKRALPRSMGHRAGTKATHNIVQACGELDVKYLTIYVFSAENWGRPQKEVSLLMDLLVEMIHKEVDQLNKNNVKLSTIGDTSRLPEKTAKVLAEGVEATAKNTGLTLILAISYGGRAEIVHATKKIAELAKTDSKLVENLTENEFSKYLYTAKYPDPELIIRTGGDLRISNFLIWQAAYSELYLTDTLWPDFNKDRLIEAIEDYGKRDRRFGKVKEA